MIPIFAIRSRKYTITLYTPGHLEIIWELFAKKSADILSFRNSFITISSMNAFLLAMYEMSVHCIAYLYTGVIVG